MLTRLLDAYLAAPRHRGKKWLLRHLLLPLVQGRPVRSYYGVRMHARPRDFTNLASISGCFRSDYDDVFAEVSALQPGMAFIDIGANAGLFSLVASQRVGERGVVLAFEPSLPVFRDLVANAAANGARNLFPFNAAVGEATTIARFAPGKDSHSGVGRLDRSGEASVLQMHFDGLAALFDEILGERETVIKIDVEGAEGQVVAALRQFLRRPQVRTVIAEIDPEFLRRFGHDEHGLYAAFAEAGFEPRRGLGAAAHYNEVFVRVGPAVSAPPARPALAAKAHAVPVP
ncbi:MAG: FkbM family methyltransferase [Phenylobacterium sp.]|uniref:FkbM family methyltransferase n=1 Tax=Phenylobacterium sp. TaxID=1871053 RepID=UPI00391D65D3